MISRWLLVPGLLALLLLVQVAPVAAQPLTMWERVLDGEPTDPEEAIALLGEDGIGGENGKTLTEFVATDTERWLEEFFEFLVALGIISEKDSGS
jgi:hypothetical protein